MARRELTLDLLVRMVAEELGCDEGELLPTMTLADLDADSLDIIELGMSLEEEFGLELSDDEVGELAAKPFGDMAEAIDARCAARKRPPR